MTGLLISFDGIDSSGKATQAYHLAQRLSAAGLDVSQLQSPDYSTATGQQLKQLLQSSSPAMSWTEKMQLFAANRAEHRASVKTALRQGGIVIYDRYVASSVAFITVEATTPQDVASQRAHIQAHVARQEYEVNRMPHEAASVFLDVPPAVTMSLLEKRKTERADNNEYTDHRILQERLYNEYDILCRTQPERFVRIPCVSGTQLFSADEISELVWAALRQRLPRLAAHHARTA
ncbi:MAG: hypothetical protein HY372_03515 [Candidatus Andersenbacteria bacterium]|nr:hypothetical protein [Candidatus Andersenbacteria bacterium]